MENSGSILLLLHNKIEKALDRGEIMTAEFVEVCDILMPLFDNLGKSLLRIFLR